MRTPINYIDKNHVCWDFSKDCWSTWEAISQLNRPEEDFEEEDLDTDGGIPDIR